MSNEETQLRQPDDFSKYLATKEPVLLVGGQAVNLWALYYEEATMDFIPFVSHDMDILGQRDTLQAIAELAGVQPTYFPLKPPSNEVGYIMPEDAYNSPMVIEVLRWVNGVSADELESNAVIFSIGEQEVPVRVPSPVILLKAKLANLNRINQKGRQDEKHVRILFQVLVEYLDDFSESVRSGRRSEREFLELLKTLLEIVTPDSATKKFASLGLHPAHLFSKLSTEGLPKISAFMRHQLQRQLSI